MNDELKLEEVLDLENYSDLMNDFEFSGKGLILKSGDEIIGCAQGEKRIDDDFYTLDLMEIASTHRSKGYGQKFLSLIKLHYNVFEIRGVSAEWSVPFWEKINATFHDTCENCWNVECMNHPNYFDEEAEYEEDYYCDDYSEHHFVV